MFLAVDYRETAKSNEAVFRNVLRDLIQSRGDRFCGKIIPTDLNPDAPIEEIYERYSTGDRDGKFTIMHCSIEAGQIWFAFQLVTGRREKGAQLHYVIHGTDVQYTGPAVIPIGFGEDDDDPEED